MKELSLEKMEKLQGGGWVEGACAIVGFGASGLAVRVLFGAAVNPGVATFFAVAGLACWGYSLWKG